MSVSNKFKMRTFKCSIMFLLSLKNFIVATLIATILIIKQTADSENIINTTYQRPKSVLFSNENAELLPRKGVKQILLWTQCRSGSNFVGDFLANSWQDRFYMEEPVKFWIKNFNGSMKHNDLQFFLESMLTCKFNRHHEWNTQRKWHLNVATELGRYMGNTTIITDDLDYHLVNCQKAKVRLFRIVHPTLGIAQPLLKNKELNIKVIYLVRDPRGVMSSRKLLKDENQFDMDTDTPHPCSRLQQDAAFVKRFQSEYPERFMLLRYEDLCLQPTFYFQKLFKFVNLNFEAKHQVKLNKHVQNGDPEKARNPLSTFRNSSSTAFKWRNQLTFRNVKNIQIQCTEAMKLFNYTVFKNEKEYMNNSIETLKQFL